ncbi:MAG: beta-ketoacyl-ACP synthase III [Planctomycetota bacterium]
MVVRVPATSSSKIRAGLVGTGSYLPSQVLSNADLAEMVDTTDEWIRERTGIRERRLAASDESTSTLATVAAKRACVNANLDPSELDLIIVATVTQDHQCPSVSCLVQNGIGATNAAAFDMQAACTGFIYGMNVASGLIKSGLHENVMVIGADTLTRFVDYTDRGTCILFGDGAGAAILRPKLDGSGILYSRVRANGAQSDLIRIPAVRAKVAASGEPLPADPSYIQMEGRQVFKFATTVFVELIEEAMTACGLSREDVNLVVPHQVNRRIIESALGKLKIPIERCFINLEWYGNTSSASVPIALDEARSQNQIKSGDIVVMLAFGSGLTWGVTVMKA